MHILERKGRPSLLPAAKLEEASVATRRMLSWVKAGAHAALANAVPPEAVDAWDSAKDAAGQAATDARTAFLGEREEPPEGGCAWRARSGGMQRRADHMVGCAGAIAHRPQLGRCGPLTVSHCGCFVALRRGGLVGSAGCCPAMKCGIFIGCRSSQGLVGGPGLAATCTAYEPLGSELPEGSKDSVLGCQDEVTVAEHLGRVHRFAPWPWWACVAVWKVARWCQGIRAIRAALMLT